MERRKRVKFIRNTSLAFLGIIAIALAVITIVAASDAKKPAFDVTKHVTDYAERYTVAVTSENAPLSFTDKNGNPTGFDVELVYKAGEIMGVTFDVEVVPWDEALSGLKDGKYKFITDTGYSIDRSGIYEFTNPILVENHVMISNDRSSLNLGNIWELKFAAMRGDLVKQTFFEEYNIAEENIIWVDSVEQALQMVDRGEADATVTADIIARQIIENDGLTNLYVGNDSLYPAISCWACKAGDTAMRDRLNQTLGMLDESGYIQELKDKWMGNESKVKHFFGNYGVPIIIGIFLCGIILTVLFMVNDSKMYQELQAQEKLYKEKLQTDEMTGLYTKAMARDLIDISAKNDPEPAVFLLFDLDGLKTINETLGYEAGDKAIKNFALALRDFFGPTTILARLSGDEFIGYVKFDGDEAVLKERLENFIASLRNFTTGGVILRCCVGAVTVNDDNNSFATLLKQGDTAMTLAKNNGRNQAVIYNSSMEHDIVNPGKKKTEKITNEEELEAFNEEVPGFTESFTWILDNRVMDNPDTLILTGKKDKIVFIDPENKTVVKCLDKDGREIENGGIFPIGDKCYKCILGKENECENCISVQCNHSTSILYTVHSAPENQEYVVRTKLQTIDGKDYLVELFKAVDSDAEKNHEYEVATASQNLVTATDYLDVNPMLDQEGFFNEQIRIISKFFGAEEGYILRMDEEMKTAAYNIPEDKIPAFTVDISDYAREKWGDIMGKNILAYNPDTEEIKDTDPAIYGILTEKNIRNSVIVPIWDGQKVYGYMSLRNLSRNFSELGALCTISSYFKRIMEAITSQDDTFNRRYYDTMTGYLSFEGFRRQLESMSFYRDDKKYALVSWDIRRFKYLNDAYGYDMGDRIIKETADLFARRLDDDEYLCRVNADRFGALCRYEDTDSLKTRLKELGDYITDYFNMNYNGRCLVELSIGIYPIDDFDEVNIDEMLNRAIIAEKTAKQVDGNTACVYDENLRTASKRESLFQSEMEEALEKHEFKVFLQPQVYIGNDPETAGLLRAEALCRWMRNGKIYATPGEFIPVFEHYGTITALDYYMIEGVCKLIDEFHRKENRRTCIAVNVSRLTFLKNDFLVNFDRIVSKYDVRPGELELEFTEGVAVNDFERFNEVIEEVKKRGMECAMDDFGSDYSNLNVLQKLPLDVLKLDKKFFDYTETGKRGDAIVGNTIRMARDLEMKTIAEGIESEDQVDTLKKISCDYIQGFVYARPMPAENYLDWVKEHSIS